MQGLQRAIAYAQTAKTYGIPVICGGVHISMLPSSLSKSMDIGVIDVFALRPMNERLLLNALKKYKSVITLEEGFVNKGGLDTLIANVLEKAQSSIWLRRMGIGDKFLFNVGSREYLHSLARIDLESIVKEARLGLRKQS